MSDKNSGTPAYPRFNEYWKNRRGFLKLFAGAVTVGLAGGFCKKSGKIPEKLPGVVGEPNHPPSNDTLPKVPEPPVRPGGVKRPPEPIRLEGKPRPPKRPAFHSNQKRSCSTEVPGPEASADSLRPDSSSRKDTGVTEYTPRTGGVQRPVNFDTAVPGIQPPP